MVSMDLDFQVHANLKSNGLEIGSTVEDEFAPKVRKPYTITKQRERWSEEEHNKFLEALQLHGRAWRRIQEHVGTKNAVQIRSHAQKFFSKVVGQKANIDGVDGSKAIEIPPPRPKKKPMHPYPRKLANISCKGTAVPKPLLNPLSKVFSHSLENVSPTSVLPSIGQNTFSSIDSAAGKYPLSTVSSADNSSQSSKDNRVLEFGRTLSGLTVEGRHNTQIDWPRSEKMASEVASSTTTTLKLFGKTLIVNDSVKSCRSNVSTSVSEQKPIYCGGTEEDRGGKSIDQLISVELTLRTSGDKSTAMHYPSHQGLKSVFEVGCDEEMQWERSWTGSSTASLSGVGISDQNASAGDSEKTSNITENELACSASRLKPSETSAFSSWRASYEEDSRSFRPYRTCINGELGFYTTMVSWFCSGTQCRIVLIFSTMVPSFLLANIAEGTSRRRWNRPNERSKGSIICSLRWN